MNFNFGISVFGVGKHQIFSAFCWGISLVTDALHKRNVVFATAQQEQQANSEREKRWSVH
jgi:hypothetical protein